MAEKEEEYKKHQKKMMSMAKGTVGLGVMTVGGARLIGGFSSALGPATAPVAAATTGALQLAGVGNLANVAMNIMPGTERKKKKSTGSKKVDQILGKG